MFSVSRAFLDKIRNFKHFFGLFYLSGEACFKKSSSFGDKLPVSADLL